MHGPGSDIMSGRAWIWRPQVQAHTAEWRVSEHNRGRGQFDAGISVSAASLRHAACCCMLLHVAFSCMLLHVAACCCICTACCCMLLHVAACCCMLLHAAACCCLLLYVAVCALQMVRSPGECSSFLDRVKYVTRKIDWHLHWDLEMEKDGNITLISKQLLLLCCFLAARAVFWCSLLRTLLRIDKNPPNRRN